jgi:hypothetical protein
VLALGDDLGEVQEGAGNGGAWDVVDLGDVVIGERRRAVDEDALVVSPGASGHGDLNARVPPVPQLVQRGGRPVR